MQWITILFIINIVLIIFVIKLVFFPKKHIGSKAQNASVKHNDLAQFFSVSLDFMCVANIDGKFEHVNPALMHRLGYVEAELLGKKVINFIHPDDIAKTHKHLRRLYQGFEVANVINRFRCRDNKYVALKWNCVPDVKNKKLYAAARDITDQEKTAKELKMLSRIARETHNGVIITDINEKIEWINSGFTRITGYEFKDVVGKKPATVFQGAKTSPETRQYIAKSIQQRKPFKTEIINYRKTGEVYWLEIDCNPLFDDDGQLEGFMAIETDITEKKKNQIEIRKKTELLEQMSQHGRIGAWEVDLVNNTLYWSDLTREIHELESGITPDLQDAIQFYKEGESRDTINKVFTNTVKTGEPWRCECQIVTSKGKEVWVASTGQAEFENNQCVRVFGSFQDIDQRKKHQLINQRSLRYSQTLEELTLSADIISGQIEKAFPLIVKACAKALKVTRVSIWFFKKQGEIMECETLYDLKSKSFSKGMTLEKNNHQDYFDVINKIKIISVSDVQKDPVIKNLLGSYIYSDKITSKLDVAISGDGRFFGALCLEHTNDIYCWDESDESFVSAIGTLIGSVYDRKIRKDTERELLIAVDKANDAVKAKSEFLASMSHEIRTPMNGVIGMLRSTLRHELAEDQRRKVYIAKKSAESLLNIINDILDFSKVDAGKLEFEEIYFNLIDLIHDTYNEMTFHASEKGINLKIDTQHIGCAHMKGDPVRIKQILNNLVSNAIKFTSEGEVKIVVKTYRIDMDSQQIVCNVFDDGIGIPKSKIKGLFDAFTQVDASTTREYGGTGLGLSIVKQLCEMMHGSVSVISEVNKGSRFTFDIRVKESAPNERLVINENKNKNIRLKERSKILLVEDNRINQEVARDFLEDLAIDVDIAENGKEALDALLNCDKAAPFDAVLMDCQMPIMDGYSATQKIRKNKAGPENTAIPIIAMTANAMNGDKQRCLDTGMDDYVSKPVDPTILFDVLCKWLPTEVEPQPQSQPQRSNINKPITNKSPSLHTDSGLDKKTISENMTGRIKPNAVVWDKAALLKRVNNKPERILRLVDLYIKDSQALIEKISVAINDKNMSDLKLASHSLKGISANLGAEHVSLLAKNIEYATKEDAAPKEWSSLYEPLVHGHKNVIGLLKAYSKDNT